MSALSNYERELLKNIDEDIDIIVEGISNTTRTNEKDSWSKSLKNLPVFTIKEINQHRLSSGKRKGSAISKTLERGRKFKEERYISSVVTKFTDKSFMVKAKCQASMKRLKRDVQVTINRKTSKIEKGSMYLSCGSK